MEFSFFPDRTLNLFVSVNQDRRLRAPCKTATGSSARYNTLLKGQLTQFFFPFTSRVIYPSLLFPFA